MPQFRLLVTLHSYFGPSWQLDVRGDTLYWVKSTNGEVVQEKTKTISAAEIDTFIKEAEQSGVFAWEEHYMHCCMLDGATWSLDLQAGNRRIQTRGTNGYPESWPQFCEALKRLAASAENPCEIML
ncbi:hypothetical protein DealDRAFT_2663 [Dethiobacter alkaliphilus AHT 1]|uniref:Uncharacterized protein n=1 Tax=Dethiobacter alkaliphilus AHT 1 TaxID=555088 RepID=C0GJK4_DETAL|nr:hypothetical protein DealDRAFT_2663 [Dethiobacter alkaliphilus AHT 1]